MKKDLVITMLPPKEPKILTVGELTLQLLSSLRNLDGRIDEILISFGKGWLTPEGEKEARDRIEKLMDTRFKLVFSMMDLNLPLSQHLEAENKILNYENLKRPRGR